MARNEKKAEGVTTVVTSEDRRREEQWLVVVRDERERKQWGGREERERGKRQIKNKKYSILLWCLYCVLNFVSRYHI